MLPFIVAGVAATTLAAAAYKYFTADEIPEKPKKPASESLGTFALWGRPNAGKTTFIARLRGEKPDHKEKIATTSRTIYSDVQLDIITDKSLQIDKIVDMPGTGDRLDDWLEMVKTGAHIFYIVDLSRIEQRKYIAAVKKDLHDTADALCKSGQNKRVNIIGSHVDESRWQHLMNDPDLGNQIHNTADIRAIHESLSSSGVAGYLYFVNLHDQENSNQLIKSIVNDFYA